MARKVLVADDSPTVQKKASGILVGEGMEVTTVSNGVAAIKKLPTVNPMVILADVAMPGKDGYEVCEYVKASKEYANVPVLLVFSDGDLYDEQRGARVRADGRIKKPFDRGELISTVSRALAAFEAAAAALKAAPPVIKAPPPPAFVAEPVDEEPIIEEKEAVPDFSQFGGGVAFAEALEEISATPAESTPPPVAAETAPSLVEAEAPILEAPIVEPEVHVPPAVREGDGEWQSQRPEPVEPTTEPWAQSASAAAGAAEPAAPAEPVLIEEHPPLEHAHEHPHEHPHDTPPATERTVMFRAPAEIAEPVLSDEFTAALPVVEPAPAESVEEATSSEPAAEAVAVQAAAIEAPVAAAVEAPPEPAIEHAPAMTLDSYSLSEAAAGQVHVPHGEAATETAAPPTVAAPAPVAEAAAEPHALDSAQVYSIVYMVVAKMSPRLPPQAIEGIAKPIADEIYAELSARPKN